MQHSVELKVGELTLRGTAHRPDSTPGRTPAVILYHGFTGTRLEQHRLLLKTSRALEAAGIASVRFDFGGHGESDGDFEEMTLTREVTEARAILDYTKKLDFVDPDRIALVGFSLGGAIAGILAGQTPEQVKALVLWAPAGMVGEILGGMRRNVPVDLTGRPQFWGNRLKPEAFNDFERWDAYRVAKPYTGPVLIAHGTEDLSVPLSASRRYLELFGNRASLKLFEGANHTFDDSDLEAQLIEASRGFLVEKL